MNSLYNIIVASRLKINLLSGFAVFLMFLELCETLSKTKKEKKTNIKVFSVTGLQTVHSNMN